VKTKHFKEENDEIINKLTRWRQLIEQLDESINESEDYEESFQNQEKEKENEANTILDLNKRKKIDRKLSQ
jgi:hypothetical protein